MGVICLATGAEHLLFADQMKMIVTGTSHV
jgi:hypothetical protein